MVAIHRQEYLVDLFDSINGNFPHIKKVESYYPKSREDMDILAKEFISEGYEGAIARLMYEGYKYSYNGYHSANVLKIKFKKTSEFKVVGFTQGSKGKDLGALLWVCSTGDDTFTVAPNMSYENRYALFQCLSKEVVSNGISMTRFDRDLKGLFITVEYAELSTKKIPLQARAIAFRTYESGPEVDIVRKVYDDCL